MTMLLSLNRVAFYNFAIAEQYFVFFIEYWLLGLFWDSPAAVSHSALPKAQPPKSKTFGFLRTEF